MIVVHCGLSLAARLGQRVAAAQSCSERIALDLCRFRHQRELELPAGGDREKRGNHGSRVLPCRYRPCRAGSNDGSRLAGMPFAALKIRAWQ